MSTPPETAIVQKRPPRIWPWIAVLVIGVALVPTGIAIFVSRSVAPLFSQVTYATPATIPTYLSSGTYYVYEESVTSQGLPAPPLESADVTFRSQDGRVDSVAAFSGTVETITLNGNRYVGEISFHVVRSGQFRIHVRSPLGQAVSVFVAPGFLTTIVHNLSWLGLSGAGGLLFVVGLVLLIVIGVQRARRRPPGAPLAPRCANGHPAEPQDRFCPSCGAPVYVPPFVVVQR